MEKATKEGGLYGRMMGSIRMGHSLGNSLRMLKLPVILTDTQLYAGAIANFYWLTQTLEDRLQQHEREEAQGLVAEMRRTLTLRAAPGYEADLAELFGEDWKAQALRARTPATSTYCSVLESAGAVELVAAAFILYGALVVGGGKSTQRKVRKVFPGCEHKLFDLSDNMQELRKQFKETFNGLGSKYPEQENALVEQAARFMALNNTVVLSTRCLPFWWWKATAVVALPLVAFFFARLRSGQPLLPKLGR